MKSIHTFTFTVYFWVYVCIFSCVCISIQRNKQIDKYTNIQVSMELKK